MNGSAHDLLPELIKDTAGQLTGNAIGAAGIIRKVFFTDKKKWMEFVKPDDYGDMVPFVAVARNGTDFAKKQYLLWKKLSVDGLPYPKHPKRTPHFLGAANVDDFLQGLAVMYAAFEDRFFLDEGVKTSRTVVSRLSMRSGAYASVVLPYLRLPLPEAFDPLKPRTKYLKYFANASSNGLIAEKLLDFGDWSNDEGLVRSARKCIEAWLNTATFRKHNVIPDHAFPFDSKDSNLMKSNSNLGFALIRSAKIAGGEEHKEKVFVLIDSLRKRHSYGYGFCNTLRPEDNWKGDLSLIATHAYCRLLMAASEFGKPELLEEAKDVAYGVADLIYNKRDARWKDKAIEDDGQGDYSILLMLLDPKREQKPLLEKIFHELLDRHYLGGGMWRDYSLESMQKTAHSKYLGGMLKYLVCYDAYLRSEDLFTTKWRYVTQDR